MRDLPKVCKHLHLPVQSGSTRVLQAMRRRHTREEYLDLVDADPRGHPGRHALDRHDCWLSRARPREDFEETLSLTRAGAYHSMFSFKYSPRPNTLASKRLPDDVSEEEKTARIVALQALQREIQTRLHEQAVGTTRRGAGRFGRAGGATTEISGRTSGNTVVNFSGPGRIDADGDPARQTGSGARCRSGSSGRGRTACGATRVVPNVRTGGGPC